MEPIKILITRLSIEGNKGALLLLMGIMQGVNEALQASDRRAEFYMTSSLPTDIPLAKKHGLEKVIPELSLKQMLKYNVLWYLGFKKYVAQKAPYYQLLPHIDIVVDSSGISFSHYERGFIFQTIRHLFDAFTILTPRLCHKRYVKFTQTIGPIHGWLSRKIATYALKRASLILPRDQATYETLQSLDLKNVTPPYPDIALTLRARAIAVNFPTDKKVIGIVLSDVLEERCRKQGIDYLAEFANFIRQHPQYHFALIPHSDSQSSDYTFSQKLFKALESEKEISIECIKPDLHPLELKYIISKCDFFIGARYHSLISALSSAVPSIGLSWNYKYDGLFALYEQEQRLIRAEQVSGATLSQYFQSLAENATSIRAVLIQKHLEVKKQAAESIAHIFA